MSRFILSFKSACTADWKTGAWQLFFLLLDHLPARRTPRARASHLETGRLGEEAAIFYLRRQGYVVVAHGWRSGRVPGDLDIIAWEGDTLCFIEVKTRSDRSFAAAEAAVDQLKRHSLRRIARYYLRQHPTTTDTRFDILSIYSGRNARPATTANTHELFRNAFDWAEGYGR
jgi:putative endonuclease